MNETCHEYPEIGRVYEMPNGWCLVPLETDCIDCGGTYERIIDDFLDVPLVCPTCLEARAALRRKWNPVLHEVGVHGIGADDNRLLVNIGEATVTVHAEGYERTGMTWPEVATYTAIGYVAGRAGLPFHGAVFPLRASGDSVLAEMLAAGWDAAQDPTAADMIEDDIPDLADCYFTPPPTFTADEFIVA